MAKHTVLKQGATGPEVQLLQEKLMALGFDVTPDGGFGTKTRNAVIAFQKSRSVTADGVVGAKTWELVENAKAAPAAKMTQTSSLKCGDLKLTMDVFYRMCPQSPKKNLETNLPFILKSLESRGFTSPEWVRLAIATVYTETRGFVPLSEFQSKYNTAPGGHPFGLYDDRRDLGNQGKPDGERYRGRGFIQLTGRENYRVFGDLLKVDLIGNPELANSPHIAAGVLAEYFKKRERMFTDALSRSDLAKARKLVNGGSHGLDVFSASYLAWDSAATRAA